MLDNAAIQSLLAAGKQYVKSGITNKSHVEALGAVAYYSRLWTHWMTLLIPCASLSVFFYLMFKYRLLPRWLTTWGLIGIALMSLSILLMIFDKGSYLWLMAPFGIAMLLVSGWLIVKGFSSDSNHKQIVVQKL